ncbi:AAA family ATPase [Magnetococcales bacterium HHB-1]
MTDKSSQEIIQSIVSAEIYEETTAQTAVAEALALPLVTVSRSFGSDGTIIAQKLSERLQVQFYDRALLKEVVRVTKADPNLMELLDERTVSMVDELVHTFLTKKNAANPDRFYRAMVKIILGISQTGGVVVGRGAHLLLPRKKVFRLRIEGSMPVCTARIAERLHIRKGIAREMIIRTNRDREAFVRKMYKRFRPEERTYYDMVISTDMFSVDQAVNTVVAAMEQAGFAVP